MIYVVWLFCGMDLDIRSENIFIASAHQTQEAGELAAAALQQQLEAASQVRGKWASLPTVAARRDAYQAMTDELARIGKEMQVAVLRWEVSKDLIEYGGWAYCVPVPLTSDATSATQT